MISTIFSIVASVIMIVYVFIKSNSPLLSIGLTMLWLYWLMLNLDILSEQLDKVKND